MITQERFVTACQKYYARNGLEPGNPEHGEWHKAHYPTPRSLGGTEWVWLLKAHHAIQGVIQSEELQHRCIYYWELDLLPKYYLPYGEKWRKVIPPRREKEVDEEFTDWHRSTWSLLLEELQERIEANPYPGKYYRLLELALRLMPEISEREWKAIFYWFNINNDKIYLPVTIDIINIESVEQQLLALMNDDNVIPASSLELVIQSSPNSKQYRNTKHQLQQRGWYWNRRRKPPTSVIQPPCNRT
jgi:hypothetical protein